jgi:ABC-2 type transport system permease protein
VSASLASQAGPLARRSIVRTLRQPAVIAPPLLFPLFLLSVNATGLQSATKIEGFPTEDFVAFALGAIFVQAALSSTVIAGAALTEDIRTGFLSRLSLTRMSGAALIVGSLAGVFVLGVVQAALFLGVGLAAGGSVESGVGGALALVPLSLVITLAFAAIGVLAALRGGTGQAVQGLFPILFVLFFLSSMALPRNLIEKEWFQTIADYNPMSYFIEAPRSLLITGWDAEALALGGGIAAAVLLAAMAAVPGQLKKRLARA